jgi:hypothetical protein
MSNKPDTSRPFPKYQGAKILSDGLSETVLDQDQRHMTSQLVTMTPLMTLDTLVPRQTPTDRIKGTMVPKFCRYLALVSRQEGAAMARKFAG